MRMMLKIVIPTETGNHAIKDGSLPKSGHRIPESDTIHTLYKYTLRDQDGSLTRKQVNRWKF
jgi:hypothetical protein